MRLPIVSIIGRPNVGKSTLFNRILKRRQAVVDPTSGVTRDRHDATAEWAGYSFILIDTGGLIFQSEEEMQRHITAQSELAIEQSDLVLFLVDGQTGVHPEEAAIANLIRKSKIPGTSTQKPVVLAVNKIDGSAEDPDVYEFLRLGIPEPIGISALAGRMIGDLLDRVVAQIPPVQAEETESLHLAIVGRPNVGKLSLVNQLLGEPRMIVSPIPGTTRDAIDTTLEFEGRSYTLIDTAGLRKPARVKEQIEFYTALRSVGAINRSNVVCVLLDASQDLSVQDFKIAEAAADAGKGLLFVVNKWDLIEKETNTAGAYVKDLEQAARTFAWVPVVFISALTGQRAAKILSMAAAVADQRTRRISTQELRRTILADIKYKPPPAANGKFVSINFVTQAEGIPPTFVFFSNYPELIGETYVRFITNRLREQFGFEGVPLRILLRQKEGIRKRS
jgi:GTP-binding protein